MEVWMIGWMNGWMDEWMNEEIGLWKEKILIEGLFNW